MDPAIAVGRQPAMMFLISNSKAASGKAAKAALSQPARCRVDRRVGSCRQARPPSA